MLRAGVKNQTRLCGQKHLTFVASDAFLLLVHAVTFCAVRFFRVSAFFCAILVFSAFL
jgi:hypothetical protein